MSLNIYLDTKKRLPCIKDLRAISAIAVRATNKEELHGIPVKSISGAGQGYHGFYDGLGQHGYQYNQDRV